MIKKETDATVLMLYSFKKETGNERSKDKSTNKKNQIIPTPYPPTLTLI